MQSDLQDNKVQMLVDKARQTMQNAYSPYSGYKVGAALLADDGTCFAGCNVECASYGATICAERTAISGAVAAGRRSFKMLAVVSSGAVPWPCGICRQVLCEFSPDCTVVAVGADGVAHTCCAKELLPNGFIL